MMTKTRIAKSFTIFGYTNARYFCGPNPRGSVTWYDTRAARDAAVTRLETAAGRDGLTDPTFDRVRRRIRSTSPLAEWYARLQEYGILRANGIDGPDSEPDQVWGPAGAMVD